MAQKVTKVRHDLVVLGEGTGPNKGMNVCLYLSDRDTPFLLAYGSTPSTSGYNKVSSEELLSGAWDEHLEKCGALWVSVIARRLEDGDRLTWRDIQEIAQEN